MTSQVRTTDASPKSRSIGPTEDEMACPMVRYWVFVSQPQYRLQRTDCQILRCASRGCTSSVKTNNDIHSFQSRPELWTVHQVCDLGGKVHRRRKPRDVFEGVNLKNTTRSLNIAIFDLYTYIIVDSRLIK